MDRLTHWVRYPHNVRFADLCREVERLGFVLTAIRGSHHKYKHRATRTRLVLTPDKTGKAKAYQIHEAYDLAVGLGLLSPGEEP